MRKSFQVKNSQHFSESDLSTNHGGKHLLLHYSPHGCPPLPRVTIGPESREIKHPKMSLQLEYIVT